MSEPTPVQVRIDVDPGISDDRWVGAVEAAFALCRVPREALYAVRVQLTEYLGGVTATLFTAGHSGEVVIGGELPFGKTPEALFYSLRTRFIAGPESDQG